MRLRTISEMPMRVGSDLPEGAFVTIEERPDRVLIYYSSAAGRSRTMAPGGLVSIVQLRDGYWEVGQSRASDGWGPLLYEVAIEYATAHGGLGLCPDQMNISQEASGVWVKFAARQDVQSFELDDPIISGAATPSNCAASRS